MSPEPRGSVARAVVGGAGLLAVAVVAGAVAIATQTWLGFGLVARAVELGVRASPD